MQKTILDVLSLADQMISYVKPDGTVDVNGAREFLIRYSGGVLKTIHPDNPDARSQVYESMTKELLTTREQLKQMPDGEISDLVLSYLNDGEMLNQAHEKIQELQGDLTQAHTRIGALEAQLNGQPNFGNAKKTQTSYQYNYQPETSGSRRFNWGRTLGVAAAVAVIGLGTYFGSKIFSTNEETTFEERLERGNQIVREAEQYNVEHPSTIRPSQRKEQIQTEKKVEYGPSTVN